MSRPMYGGAGMGEVIIIIVCSLIVAAAIAVLIFFLLTLYRNLGLIKPKNRSMKPGKVWLNLIPLFGLGWMIYTVIALKNSNKREFEERKIQVEGNYGYGIGLTYAVLMCASIIPYLGTLSALAGLVFFIIYWVKIAGLNTRLRESDSKRK
jgi:hypothetical protein